VPKQIRIFYSIDLES